MQFQSNQLKIGTKLTKLAKKSTNKLLKIHPKKPSENRKVNIEFCDNLLLFIINGLNKAKILKRWSKFIVVAFNGDRNSKVLSHQLLKFN